MKKYDYLIVGAGLYGATFAYEAAKKGMPRYTVKLDCRCEANWRTHTQGPLSDGAGKDAAAGKQGRASGGGHHRGNGRTGGCIPACA